MENQHALSGFHAGSVTCARPNDAGSGYSERCDRVVFPCHATGNSDFIRQAFTPDARIEFVEDGQLRQWAREEFATKFQTQASDEYRRVRRVEQLDITGTAASATVTLDYPQVRFTDHLSLLKIGNQWKVVNKTFSADHRNAGQEAIKDTLQNWSLPFKPRRI
ncbi:MAG TPA: nuclear transport factor 2 family protein, partial [Candidatus Sulfotelmatobacter sp.]|nr:nuclear transport factor 2 family protein [Candidatus Sulfotelmatobacter sp.]